MQPVLFHIGPYPIFSYGVFVLLGMVLLFTLTARLANAGGSRWNILSLWDQVYWWEQCLGHVYPMC